MSALMWVAPVALGMAGMGALALAQPNRILALFGITSPLPRAAQNEVRAVYGGFGIAAAVALLWACSNPLYGPGVLLGMALLFTGMAAGRVIDLLVAGQPGRIPLLFIAVELLLAGLLLGGLGAASRAV